MRYLGLAVLFMSMFFGGCASRSVESETPEYRAAVMLQKAWDGKAIDKVMAANPDAILHEEPKYDWSTRGDYPPPTSAYRVRWMVHRVLGR